MDDGMFAKTANGESNQRQPKTARPGRQKWVVAAAARGSGRVGSREASKPGKLPQAGELLWSRKLARGTYPIATEPDKELLLSQSATGLLLG